MNAADLYRKSFACLPERELEAYYRRKGSDDSDTDRFVEQGRGSLDLLHLAARCADCDWGTQADVPAAVDDFGGGRRLGTLAMLRAEAALRRGDDRAALDDLAAVMALGRHIARGLYVSGLAGFPIEDLAVTKVFEILDRLEFENRRAFAVRLDSLPAFRELADAIRAEQNSRRSRHRPGEVTAEKLSALHEAAISNPLLADQLRTFDMMRPIWQRYRARFASLRERIGVISKCTA
jgi:hypothetical protein